MIYSHKAKLIKKQNKSYLRTMNKDLRIRELFAYAPASLRFNFYKKNEHEELPALLFEGAKNLQFSRMKLEVVKWHVFLKVPSSEGTVVLPLCPYNGGDEIIRQALEHRGALMFVVNGKTRVVRLNYNMQFILKDYIEHLWFQPRDERYSVECFYCVARFPDLKEKILEEKKEVVQE